MSGRLTSPRLLDVDETAVVVGQSARTVYRMIADKQIAAVRVRGRWRITRPALAKLLHVSVDEVDAIVDRALPDRMREAS